MQVVLEKIGKVLYRRAAEGEWIKEKEWGREVFINVNFMQKEVDKNRRPE